MLPNDLKLRIDVVDQLETDFVMAKTQQFPLQQTPQTRKICIRFTYNTSIRINKKEIDELFIANLVPIMDDIDHPVLIIEWKQNFDATAYEKYLN